MDQKTRGEGGVVRTKFVGYCKDCGLLLGAHEEGCGRCGSTSVTEEKPVSSRPPVDRSGRYALSE